MSDEETIKERFCRDIQNHKMHVDLDSGVYCHLRFNDGTFNMAFQIITIPGRLWYCGDMGSYTFCRVNDMFEFFRSRKPGELQINPHYWAEKLESYDRDGVEQYSPEETRALVFQHCKDNDWPEAAITELEDDVDFGDLHSGTDIVIEQLSEFRYSDPNGESYELSDSWEYICRDYTLRFLWCCCALCWGIEQYDKHKSEPAQ